MPPDLPFINDTEENLYGILGYCKDAGVKGIIKFDFGVTLREGDREYLYKCFDKDFPGMKQMYQFPQKEPPKPIQGELEF